MKFGQFMFCLLVYLSYFKQKYSEAQVSLLIKINKKHLSSLVVEFLYNLFQSSKHLIMQITVKKYYE